MALLRGDIYLADLEPRHDNNEIGKKRPVVVLQNNELNSILDSVIVFPVSSVIVENSYPLRLDIQKSFLDRDSQVVINQIRAISVKRLEKKLGSLSKSEIDLVCSGLEVVLGCRDVR
ncbi:MAG: type II toxin-antitoxin system PemK/MazF family toxin [Campylobacterales bacterium]